MISEPEDLLPTTEAAMMAHLAFGEIEDEAKSIMTDLYRRLDQGRDRAWVEPLMAEAVQTLKDLRAAMLYAVHMNNAQQFGFTTVARPEPPVEPAPESRRDGNEYDEWAEEEYDEPPPALVDTQVMDEMPWENEPLDDDELEVVEDQIHRVANGENPVEVTGEHPKITAPPSAIRPNLDIPTVAEPGQEFSDDLRRIFDEDERRRRERP